MMRFLRAVLALVVVIGAMSATGGMQRRLDGFRASEFDEEMLYLPNERLLNHFTGGMSSIIADLLWLRCIGHTVEEFHKGRKPEWLAHMTHTITELDPYFVGAYKYGGTLLAAIQAEETSLALLRKGMRNRPESWEIPFEISKVYILNRRDEPESPAMASYYLTVTAETPGNPNPEYFLQWADHLQVRHDLVEFGEHIWQRIHDTTTDPFMRELAKRKLDEFQIRRATVQLNELADAYEQQTGRRPQSFDELRAAGLLLGAGDPVDPQGGRFFFDAEGAVQNSTLLDAQTGQLMDRLRTWLDRFRNEQGRWPESLDELATQHFVRSGIPRHPYEDRTWFYNPYTGAIGDRPKPGL